MSIESAFAVHEWHVRQLVLQETWGHRAPKKGKTYAGRVVYAVGCYGSDYLNPTVLYCRFGELDDSPWFFDALQELIRSGDNEIGCVYEWVGTFRNYTFEGKQRLLLDSNIINPE